MAAVDSHVLIFGAGSHARKVAEALLNKGHHVLGFVVSRPTADSLDDLPVYGWSSIGDHQFPSVTQLICAIFNRNDPYAELVALANRYGFDRILMPWDYYPYLERDLGWCYWLSPESANPLETIEASIPYQQVLSLLADQESKDTFRRIHAFRQGDDLAFSKATASEPQYFNDFTLAPFAERPSITYLDVGAYDGDTLRILSASKAVTRAILFEPEATNYAALQVNLKDLNQLHPAMKIQALPLALGNDDHFLQISGQGEAASLHGAADASDSRLIHVVRGDDLFPFETIDFIKIDAEGADLDALLGMADMIRRSSPVLAVSLYHRPRDITDLPIAISSLLEGLSYRFYLRQHMYNSFESVFYAVPCP